MKKYIYLLQQIKKKFTYRLKKYYYKLIELKLSFYNQFKIKNGLNKQKRDNHIVISLTSYYKRFDVVHLTLEALLNQEYQPDKIILWLSQEDIDKTPLPIKVLNLQKRGVDIRIVKENIRSYKKLIYSLKEYPDSYIVTCDDDILYPSWFLKYLVATSNVHTTCIVAYTCRILHLTKHNIFKPYEFSNYVSYAGPSLSLLPIGASGIMYPPHSLHQEVHNKEIFLKLAPMADDLWFKAMALLNNTQTVLVNNRSITFFRQAVFCAA